MSKKSPRDPATDRFATIDDVAAIESPKSEPPKPTAPTMAFGCGHLEDEHDDRDFKARALFGARRDLPAEVTDLEAHTPSIWNQGSTSSCVGQAIGGAIETRLRRMGRRGAKVSRLAAYTFARSLAKFKPDSPMSDEGCFPRLAMKGLKEWGIPEDRVWPFDVSKVNADLPWDVMQAASAFTISAWWRIGSFGQERTEDICQALASGYPVIFGVPVDSGFQAFRGSEPIADPQVGSRVGGHMMFVVGYRTINGERIFRCANSWGTDWGDDGFYWARESFFRKASDMYVIQVG